MIAKLLFLYSARKINCGRVCKTFAHPVYFFAHPSPLGSGAPAHTLMAKLGIGAPGFGVHAHHEALTLSPTRIFPPVVPVSLQPDTELSGGGDGARTPPGKQRFVVEAMRHSVSASTAPSPDAELLPWTSAPRTHSRATTVHLLAREGAHNRTLHIPLFSKRGKPSAT